MAAPLWANRACLLEAQELLVVLSSGASLHLFQNVFNPTPSTALSAFHECSFTGYAGIALSTVWTGPTLVQDGQYQLDSGVLLFTCTGGSGQNIAGWYIRSTAFLLACEAFASPIFITPGTQLSIDLRPQIISQSIL